MLKKPLMYEQRYFTRQNSKFPLPVNPALLLDDFTDRLLKRSGGQIKISPVNIILPWFFMLIYHLGDEQEACWWPQFKDIVSPHLHDHHHHHHNIQTGSNGH
jgi:hypothetical protein